MTTETGGVVSKCQLVTIPRMHRQGLVGTVTDTTGRGRAQPDPDFS
jgi:hypothetical protein